MISSRALISGAFGDSRYQLGFFEQIAAALTRDGVEVARFNSFGFDRPAGCASRMLERLFTLPGRCLGFDKEGIRAALPWTPQGQRERALLAAVRQFRPDTLIVIRGFPHRPRTLEHCRKLGVKNLVGWNVEGPLDATRAEKESQHYDRYYCIHTEIAAAYRARIGWLPSYGLDTTRFSRLHWPRSTRDRIVFVGTPTERRIRYLQTLRSLPLDLWGPKWNRIGSLAEFHRGDFIWGAELNALYNESAIVLNIASWDPNLSGMTQRILEIPASGAFMLTDDAPGVRRIFEPGKEVDVFTTPESLRQQCERYLADPPLREQVADRGHERALQQGDFTLAAHVLSGRAPAPLPPATDAEAR